MKDDCSVRFSEVFYRSFFVENMSVCEAFELTIEDIKKRFGENDAGMYVLMKKQSKHKRHECFPIEAPENGFPERIDKVPSMVSVPAREERFEGR